MISTENTKIARISVHNIGNKFTDQGLLLSQKEVSTDNDTLENLIKYFLKPFKIELSLNFFHESNLNFNVVYVCIKNIFKNPNLLHENSVSIAKHLYERSDHPNIKGGEFYTVYFENCILNGKTLNAIGLFKSENKDTFLKVYSTKNDFEVESEKGININKLDKGCLIFDTEEDSGYVLGIIDSRSKGAETQYWVDDFLHVCQRKDEYSNTQNILSLCKDFIKNKLPLQFEISKADQIDLLNRSMKFFKENDNFDINNFANEVIKHPDVIESFNNYKTTFQQNNNIDIVDNFTISDSAVKKQARLLKSIIKLDKNFDIHIHGNRNLIEQGIDEKGKYYKVYYKEES